MPRKKVRKRNINNEQKNFVLIAKLIPCFKLDGLREIFEAVLGFKLKYQGKLSSLANKYPDLFLIVRDGTKTAFFSTYFPHMTRNVKDVPIGNGQYYDMIKYARLHQYLWYQSKLKYSLDTFEYYTDLFVVRHPNGKNVTRPLLISRIHGKDFLDSDNEINQIVNIATKGNANQNNIVNHSKPPNKHKKNTNSNNNEGKTNNNKIKDNAMTSVALELKLHCGVYFETIAKLFPCIQFDNEHSFKQFCVLLFKKDVITLAYGCTYIPYTLVTLLGLFKNLFIVKVIKDECFELFSKYFVYSEPKNYCSMESQLMVKLGREYAYVWYKDIKDVNILLRTEYDNFKNWNIDVFKKYHNIFFVENVKGYILIISRIIGSELLKIPNEIIAIASQELLMNDDQTESETNVIEPENGNNESELNTYLIFKKNELNELNDEYIQLNDMIKKQNNGINRLNQLNDDIICQNKSLTNKYNIVLQDYNQLKCDDNVLNELNTDQLCDLHDICLDNASLIQKEIQQRMENELICNICYDTEMNAALQCGHRGCYACLTQLKSCHICRSSITLVVKIQSS